VSSLGFSPLVPPPNARPETSNQTELQFTNAGDPSLWTHRVAGEVFEWIISVFCVMTTSAAVATRTVTLNVLDQDGHNLMILPGATGQAASLEFNYNWLTELNQFASVQNTNNMQPLPRVLFPPGYSLTLNINSFQGGDAFTQIKCLGVQMNSGPHLPDTPAAPTIPTPVIV